MLLFDFVSQRKERHGICSLTCSLFADSKQWKVCSAPRMLIPLDGRVKNQVLVVVLLVYCLLLLVYRLSIPRFTVTFTLIDRVHHAVFGSCDWRNKQQGSYCQSVHKIRTVVKNRDPRSTERGILSYESFSIAKTNEKRKIPSFGSTQNKNNNAHVSLTFLLEWSVRSKFDTYMKWNY